MISMCLKIQLAVIGVHARPLEVVYHRTPDRHSYKRVKVMRWLLLMNHDSFEWIRYGIVSSPRP